MAMNAVTRRSLLMGFWGSADVAMQLPAHADDATECTTLEAD